jgi:homoserine kinase type II
MAVYTDISETELQAFMANYALGGVLSYRGIAEGVENSNFMLHMSEGPFILTLYEKRVDAADLPFFLGLMEHLAGRGVHCPLPVHQKDGAVIGKVGGRPAAVITFLEGMWPRRPNRKHCRAVGEALAGMHVAGRDFGLRRPNALSVGSWRPLWDKCLASPGGFAGELKDEVEGELATLEAKWPDGLPDGVIHADLFPDNVFFLGDELSGLIDFYFACNDLLAYDLAVCLNAWCFEKDHSFNLTKGTALLSGYQSVRELEKIELEALPMLARGAALRFMLTRLYDWMNTPEGSLVVKKDPLEYMNRLRFHRSIASASEYGVI